MKKYLLSFLLFSLLTQAQCWVQISYGKNFDGFRSLGIQSNGSLWAWGLNHKGQLSDGTTTNRNGQSVTTKIIIE
jgi:alpha-tubulin suppressor-like RCC1 family protein